MKFAELHNKRILIIGFGIEGQATFEFLSKHFPNAHIAHIDKNDSPDYLKEQKKYDVVIRGPGVKKGLITKPSTTSTNIFFELARGKTIGVTGTKGKSTTSALIHHILKIAGKQSHLVGNIGQPALTELLKTNTQEDVWVYELSSYMLSDVEYAPNISVITNLYPEHMDYHGTIEEYYQAKKRIVTAASKQDMLVYNPAFEELRKLAAHTRAFAIPFVPAVGFGYETKLRGNHNKDNIRAAVTVAKLFEIADENIKNAIATFAPLPHRLEFVGTVNDISFYNDALSTTPQSTIAAIEALENIGCIFLGGQNRGYDFANLAQVIVDQKIPNLVLFPESGEAILDAVRKMTTELPHLLSTTSMQEAVEFAYKHTPKGTICLLSSASPSYSLWKNFEEKGNEFKRFVQEVG